MIKTTITDRDPTTGRLVAIPPDLRDRVADAAKQLTVDLWDLGEPFGLRAEWRYEATAPGVLDVLLELTSRTGAGMSARYPAADFFRPDEFRRQMQATMRQLGRVLSDIPTRPATGHPNGVAQLEAPVEA